MSQCQEMRAAMIQIQRFTRSSNTTVAFSKSRTILQVCAEKQVQRLYQASEWTFNSMYITTRLAPHAFRGSEVMSGIAQVC